MDHEYIAKGTVWTNGKMKVVISQIQKTEKVRRITGSFSVLSLEVLAT